MNATPSDAHTTIDPLLAERIRVAVDELREADLELAAAHERHRARADGAEGEFLRAVYADSAEAERHELRMMRSTTIIQCLRFAMLAAITLAAGTVVFRCLRAPAVGGTQSDAEVADAR